MGSESLDRGIDRGRGAFIGESLRYIREMPINFDYQVVFGLGSGTPSVNIKRIEYAAELALKKRVPLLVSGGKVSKAHRSMGISEADEAYNHVMSNDYYKERFERAGMSFERETKARSTVANIRNALPYLKRNGFTRILIVTDQTSHAKRAIAELKRLYPQVDVSFYTPRDPNVDANVRRGLMVDNVYSGSRDERRDFGADVTQDLPLASPDNLENPGGLHEDVRRNVDGISQNLATEDLGRISELSLRNLRASGFMLEKEKTNNQDLALGVRKETERLIKAYTSDVSGEWYSLDYSKLDNLSVDRRNGWSHEYDIGLGEILRDPDIKNILVQKGNKVIKAHRGIVPDGQKYAGRVAFLDENNQYVATHTGDKFRILDENRMDLSVKLNDYVGEYANESKARDAYCEKSDDQGSSVDQSRAMASDIATSLVADEGGGGEPLNLTYESGKRDRLKMGTRQLPYRFFSLKLHNANDGKDVIVSNGGAPGRSTPSTSGGKPREAFKDEWARTQLLELYNRGIRVVVSLVNRDDMARVVKSLEREGKKIKLITASYLCTPPGKRNLRLFEEVGSYIKRGESVYVHCTHGTHRAPSCTAGALIAAGVVKSFGQALDIAGLDPRNFTTDYRRQMLRQIAEFAKSKGLKVESSDEYARLTSSDSNVAVYRKIFS